MMTNIILCLSPFSTIDKNYDSSKLSIIPFDNFNLSTQASICVSGFISEEEI